MKNYKSYPKYKDSGISWLGSIPGHWKLSYIKGITRTYSEKNKPELELLSVYRDYGVIKKSSRDDNHNKPGMDLSSYKVVYPNTLVLNKMKTWSGSLGVSNYLGIVSPAYITCEIDLEQLETKYLNYLLRCRNYVFEYNRLSYGVRPSQWDMRYQDFKSIPIFLPLRQEQTAIANFLDYKLSKINRFIRKKKQLIKLLNEQKAAIINQAVTKGLDPNAKMKESGIEWLGEIPAHWEVTRTKYLGKAIIGLTYKPSDETNSERGTLVLRSSNVQNEKITYDNCVYVTTEIPENKITRIGDILICSRNGSVKLIGKNALIDEKSSGLTFGAFMTVFRSPNYEFLHYFFNSASFKAQSGLFSTSTINQLTTGILNNIILVIPKSLEEQLEIVNYIKKETARINVIISKIEKEISLVEEFKTALIAEAVTGKIDVRDFVVPDFADSYLEEEENDIDLENVEEYETIEE